MTIRLSTLTDEILRNDKQSLNHAILLFLHSYMLTSFKLENAYGYRFNSNVNQSIYQRLLRSYQTRKQRSATGFASCNEQFSFAQRSLN